MRKGVKAISVLLLFCVLLGFTGCNDKAKIVGKWKQSNYNSGYSKLKDEFGELEFTKTGKLFFIYKENGKEITESATWNSSDFLNFIVDEISDANKFIDKNSKIQVAYSANGACTISFFTKITGSKTYDAQLTVNLE